MLLLTFLFAVPLRSAFAQAPGAGPMVFVRGGTVQMGINFSDIPRLQRVFGTDSARLFQDAIPKHRVTVRDFRIDKYLVTNAQFRAFTDLNPQWQPGRISPELDNGNYLKHWQSASAFASPDHPVVNVNWYAAVAYCQWAGKRLPTEAEWEYAARANRKAIFPWGDEAVDRNRANFSGSGLHTTSPVGSYPANSYGIFDMAGNVWQFLADQWAPYPSAPQKNPIAGGDSFQRGNSFFQVHTRRVIRGGSFDGAPVNLWVEYRDSHPPNGSQEFVGFRCAK